MFEDQYPEQCDEVRNIVQAVVEEQVEWIYEGDHEAYPISYEVEEHNDEPALVLYSEDEERPNVGGQFLIPLVRAGYIPSAFKDQATESEGSRVFLIHESEWEADEEAPGENILQAADATVGQRAEEYGPPTENFQAIADMWSAYLGIEVTCYDYSQMMILAKIGRTKTGSPDRDTHQDQAGYSLTTSLVNEDGSEPGPYYGGKNNDN